MDTDTHYKILIVDDIEDNRFTLDIMLSVLGEFDINEAESGPEALSMMSNKNYDLVLLDIMMPGMTGLEVLEKLELAKATSPTNIIVVSALQDMDTVVKALEMGALDYLPKPIEEALLGARLRQLIGRWETEIQLKQHRARIDADLKKAAEIQLSLCPGETSHISVDDGLARFEFAGIMCPAYEVGGDFFDYFELPNGNKVFVVADACGKGAPGAIYATRVHDLLRLTARNQTTEILSDAEHSLAQMVSEVNTVLAENNEDCWFVTAWVGILNPDRQQLHWCSAGHCEALLQDKDGSIQTLNCEVGLPLGLDDSSAPAICNITLNPGSVVHIYTDGITEHRQENGTFLGIDGFMNILAAAADTEDLRQMISQIADTIKDLNPGHPPEDDVTLLSLKFLPG